MNPLLTEVLPNHVHRNLPLHVQIAWPPTAKEFDREMERELSDLA
jgi:hypothetical protein